MPLEAEGKKTLFFHSKDLSYIMYDELKVGELLTFDLVQGPKGPVAVNVSRNDVPDQYRWAPETVEAENARARTTITEVIEEFRRLTPDLIQHLRRENKDIEKVSPSVFEHLIAELMMSAGWHDVRLVGRNPQTHADIFALHYIPTPTEFAIRFFVEVKRWKRRIGVEIINQVLGAMVSERERHGWHAAMIVTLGGVSDTRSFSQDEYRMKGIEVKDKEDILHWLRHYRPSVNGLWVKPDYSEEVPCGRCGRRPSNRT